MAVSINVADGVVTMRRLAVVLLLLVVSASVVYANERPLVAVMPFEEGRIEGEHNRRWWQREGAALLDAIREAFTDQLIASGKFRVLERSRLDQVMKELQLQASDWFDPGYAVEIGRLVGAPFLLMGTVTKFDIRETAQIGVGNITWQGTGAEIALRVRIVETETAIALASVFASGTASSGDLFVRLPAPLSGSLQGGSPVDAAVHHAVLELAEKVVAAFEDLQSSPELATAGMSLTD